MSTQKNSWRQSGNGYIMEVQGWKHKTFPYAHASKLIELLNDKWEGTRDEIALFWQHECDWKEHNEKVQKYYQLAIR